MMIRLSNGIELPESIVRAFEESGNGILCVLHKTIDKDKFSTRELRMSQFDLNLIQTIIKQNGWQKEGGEFAIIDANGNILHQTEGSDISIEVDSNGYMHVNGEEYVMHAHKDGFVSGETKEKVDRMYARLLERGFYSRDESFGDDGFVSKHKKIEFKDTIMGKMTKGAIINWGEKDENKEWFRPTEEQAEAMISEGGLQIGSKIFDYSSSDKATKGKTYGSEEAATKGIVELIAEAEGLSEEQKKELTEQIKSECYTQSTLSPELSTRIRTAMESKGIETSIVEVLGTIHNNWVKDNGDKFDAPDRANRLHQFVDLRLMSFGEDGATADLLFLQPILEGAGISVDLEKLQTEFEKQQKEYMEEYGITDSKGLREYLSNISENYPTIGGVTTTKGQKDDLEKGIRVPRYLITDELQKSEILERMTEQVSAKIGIEYKKEEKPKVADRTKHMMGTDEVVKKVAEDLGLEDVTSFTLHDKAEPHIGHEDPKVLEEIAKKSRSGIEVEPKATKIIESAAGKVDAKKIIEAGEAYDLAPAETKKSGFINYVKGIVEKIKGIFGR